jgi:hypothetical protein
MCFRSNLIYNQMRLVYWIPKQINWNPLRNQNMYSKNVSMYVVQLLHQCITNRNYLFVVSYREDDIGIIGALIKIYRYYTRWTITSIWCEWWRPFSTGLGKQTFRNQILNMKLKWLIKLLFLGLHLLPEDI